MTGEELKNWRIARNWSQQKLAEELGLHRDSIVRHEKADEVPRQVELALLALTLGGRRYNGREVILNQFRLEHFETKSGVPMEQLVSVRWGRSKSTERGEIREWLLDREGIQLDTQGVFHVSNDAGLDYEIKNKWF